MNTVKRAAAWLVDQLKVAENAPRWSVWIAGAIVTVGAAIGVDLSGLDFTVPFADVQVDGEELIGFLVLTGLGTLVQKVATVPR